MKQYCRYCCNLVTGNGICCTEKEQEISEAAKKMSRVLPNIAQHRHGLRGVKS